MPSPLVSYQARTKISYHTPVCVASLDKNGASATDVEGSAPTSGPTARAKTTARTASNRKRVMFRSLECFRSVAAVRRVSRAPPRRPCEHRGEDSRLQLQLQTQVIGT